MIFAEKIVLVTGSTTGIGEACAQVFAESGAKVMVSGRHEPRGRAVVEAIRAKGGQAQFAAVDLRAAGACDRLVADTIERWGGLDILVNNAGILYTADALGTTDEQWLDTMSVNVNALFYLSRAAVKHMKAAGKGAIVNIASEWGLNGEANHVAYCASKGAVIEWWTTFSPSAAAILRAICGTSRRVSRCGAWHIPPKSRVACISWRPTSRAT